MSFSARHCLIFSLCLIATAATPDKACAARAAAMALTDVAADAPFAPAPAQPDIDGSSWASVDHYSVRPIFYSARQKSGLFLVTDPGSRVAGESAKSPRFTVGICELSPRKFDVNYETQIELKMINCREISSDWAPSTSKNVSAFNERWRADLNQKYEAQAKAAISSGAVISANFNLAARSAFIKLGLNGLLTYPGFSGSLAMAGGSSEGVNLDGSPVPFPSELLPAILKMAEEACAKALKTSASASATESDKTPDLESAKAG